MVHEGSVAPYGCLNICSSIIFDIIAAGFTNISMKVLVIFKLKMSNQQRN